mgnify:CR=1 FL=1
MTSSTFQIYNASAGSGKTFTLTKAYLKAILQSKASLPFTQCLALTFTNKAVDEMKSRIIKTLQEFSEENYQSNVMFNMLCEELNITPKELKQKSKYLLQQLINNYAAFNVSTIDGFNHRLIRTFAKDLKLPVNFEVALEQEQLLDEAVDALIARAGIDDQLTNVLVDFALEKANDDKSWDIILDLKSISKLLINDNHTLFINGFADKSLDDFMALKQKLLADKKSLVKKVISLAASFFELIESNDINHSDFTAGYIPKFFSKIKSENFKDTFTAKWQDTIADASLYPKRVDDDIKDKIDALQPQIAELFFNIKKGVFNIHFFEALYKSITPLSLIFEINKELTLLKEDRNLVLISEFNRLISEQIKDQPTPFIYERLGEKFRHYFIDEFQDTSLMQWQNSVPLIDNALASTRGSLMLVGDAKQSIYRWRGSRAEQFINLYEQDENPFQIESQIIPLDSNYRSYKAIVNFNNDFFNFLSARVFSDASHQKLFEKATQNTIVNIEGYVHLSFIEKGTKSEMDEPYGDVVFKQIESCLADGFQPNDICVLVRKKKEGVALTNYLIDKGIQVSSSETLLLKHSPKVKFLIQVLKLINTPEDQQVKIEVLSFLADKLNIEHQHEFFESYLEKSIGELFLSLKTFGIEISYAEISTLSLYEMTETLMRSFLLIDDQVAQLQFFLDVVFEFSQQQDHTLSSFLDYYDTKKDKLSVSAREATQAVSLLTVHKSKGLEFPVVIFPYADLDIYQDIDPKVWFPLDKTQFLDFEYMLISINSKLENFGDIGAQIYTDYRSQMELDQINILYVALTRAVKRLYVVSALDFDKNGNPNNKTYSGFFIQYLQHTGLWNDHEVQYEFGTKTHKKSPSITAESKALDYEFISTPKDTHQIKIVTKSGQHWLTDRTEAIEFGNLLHLIFSKIKTKNDVDFVFDDMLTSGEIQLEQAERLQPIINAVVTHPELSKYYIDDFEIYNEQKILTPDGQIYIPDRIVIDNNKNTTIIDYKTGSPRESYADQLKLYHQILESMGYVVLKKLLVYVNDDVVVTSVD